MVTWTLRKIGIKTEEEELKFQLGEDVLFRQWMWIFKGPQQAWTDFTRTSFKDK